MSTTIYGETGDGDVYVTSSAGVSSWEDARDATSGLAAFNAQSNTTAVRAVIIGSGRATTYSVSRAFFIFDVRGITRIPKLGRLSIYGLTNTAADMRLVKSTQGTNVSNADFDAIEGWVAGGDNSSNVTLYDTSVTNTWVTTGYNNIELSQQALVDIAGLNIFKCCLINNRNDIRDETPTAPEGLVNYSGLYYKDALGTSRDPYLNIVEQDDSVFFGTNF